MEVKINKEIRNYTESMFFGLSLRQFIFSVLACASPALWNGNAQLGVHLRCVPLCGYGLYQVQRYDRRAVCLGVDKVRVSDAEKDCIFARQSLLQSVEADH